MTGCIGVVRCAGVQCGEKVVSVFSQSSKQLHKASWMPSHANVQSGEFVLSASGGGADSFVSHLNLQVGCETFAYDIYPCLLVA